MSRCRWCRQDGDLGDLGGGPAFPKSGSSGPETWHTCPHGRFCSPAADRMFGGPCVDCVRALADAADERDILLDQREHLMRDREQALRDVLAETAAKLLSLEERDEAVAHVRALHGFLEERQWHLTGHDDTFTTCFECRWASDNDRVEPTHLPGCKLRATLEAAGAWLAAREVKP